MNNSSIMSFDDYYETPNEAESVKISVSQNVEIVLDLWSRGTCKNQSFLLIHGLASNARMWDGVALTLMRLGHKVAAIDLRGHGRSSKPESGYDFPTICDDIEKVQDYLIGLDPSWKHVVAVGQSWGASLVLELGWRSPKRLFGLGCVDGGFLDLSQIYPDWQDCKDALHPPLFDHVTAEELESRIRATHMEWPEAGIRGLLANFHVDEDGIVSPWLSLENHLDILHSLWMFKASVRHSSISVPVLLMPAITQKDILYSTKGINDKNTPRKDAQNVKHEGMARPFIDKRLAVKEAADKLAKSDIYEFIDSEHDIHASKPEELAHLLHKKSIESFFSGPIV